MSRRIRSVKPEWLEDERMSSCSDAARMVSIALITMADDYGNGRANEMFLAAQIWPYSRDPHESLTKLHGAVQELCAIEFVSLFAVKGQRYFSIRNWAKHQKVQHPGKPLVPGPDMRDDASPSPLMSVSREPHENLMSDLDQEGKGGEGRDLPPPPDEISSRDVAAEWHRVGNGPNCMPGLMHAEHSYRRDYETCAAVLNQLPASRRRVALQALIAWFWTAQDGPVASGRCKPAKATPRMLARGITSDLDSAAEWFVAQQEAAQ